MRRQLRWLGPLVGAAILAALVGRVGAAPFLAGLQRLDGWTLVVTTLVGAVATVAAAARWRIVAHTLDVPLPFGAAVAAYYRAQFLNVLLPGGVLGDVERGVRHGRRSAAVGRGLRSVVVERLTGQAVQLALAALVLVVLPSPVRLPAAAPAIVGGLTVITVLAVVVRATVVRATAVRATAVRATVVRATVNRATAVRSTLVRSTATPRVIGLSVLAVAAHVATFAIAARGAGATLPLAHLVPIALLVLVAMSLPLSVAGWGPREGVAGWAFASAGLGLEQGVTTAVIYGVMVLVGSLPGVIVVVADRLAASRPTRRASQPGAPGRSAEVVLPLGSVSGPTGSRLARSGGVTDG